MAAPRKTANVAPRTPLVDIFQASHRTATARVKNHANLSGSKSARFASNRQNLRVPTLVPSEISQPKTTVGTMKNPAPAASAHRPADRGGRARRRSSQRAHATSQANAKAVAKNVVLMEKQSAVPRIRPAAKNLLAFRLSGALTRTQIARNQQKDQRTSGRNSSDFRDQSAKARTVATVQSATCRSVSRRAIR